MLNRSDIMNTPGYKYLLSIGGMDVSGPIQQKSGAFQFSRPKDYGEYKITKNGDVKRQSAGPAWEMGRIDKNSLTSYSAGFKKIAEKMLQIEEKQKKENAAYEQKQYDLDNALVGITQGKPFLTPIKSRNLIKKLFKTGKFDNIHLYEERNPDDIKRVVKRWAKDPAVAEEVITNHWPAAILFAVLYR